MGFTYLISGVLCGDLCGTVFPCYNEFWVWWYLGGVFVCVAVSFYLCDGKPDVPVSTVIKWGVVSLIF